MNFKLHKKIIDHYYDQYVAFIVYLLYKCSADNKKMHTYFLGRERKICFKITVHKKTICKRIIARRFCS